MDIIFSLLVIILVGWLVASYFYQNKKQFRSTFKPRQYGIPQTKTPYQKMIDERNADWQVKYQKQQLKKHEALFKKAQIAGDMTQMKVQKSMVVFTKSLISRLMQLLQSE